MNKKLFLTIFLTLTLSAAFAQNVELKHYFRRDFDGYAYAGYVSNLLDDETLSGSLEQRIEQVFEDLSVETDSATLVKKLTKNNKWLIGKALAEWDLERGEAYLIACADSMNPESCLLVFAVITTPGNYEYLAWVVGKEK